jgi:hypothetical protein
MGISDDSMANAIRKQMQGQMQGEKLLTREALYKNKELTLNDLDHDAMKSSIDDLISVWQLRFGYEWVKEDELTSDDFWRIAFLRLGETKHLERHRLADIYSYVYRLID